MRFFASLAATLVLLCSLASPALGAPSQLDEHTATRLAHSNGWWRLLHYQNSPLRPQSQVDDPAFFLHPNGKRQPVSELQATLKQLDRALSETLPENEDVRCRFPARIDWLRRTLQHSIPVRSCTALDDWLEQIDAGSLTLVFPAGYLNNAASMFGHSLLRIDSRDQASRPDLVTWAINYAAEANPNDGGVTYAVKGMTGLYPGYFSLMPYYEKVNEYSHLENRDIWEYPLDIQPEGMQRVLWHLWELDKIRFDYWFFDENCSYQLLALLSVAGDELNLTRSFNLKALPVDTIRALDDAGLLLAAGRFRPSFATGLQTMSRQVSPQELALVQQLVFDRQDPASLPLAPADNPARVHELAFQWLNFRYHHQGLSREQAAPQLHRLLVARSRVADKAGFTPVAIPGTAPHQGHDTAQWSLASGHQGSDNYLQLAAKPAYHSRFDAVEGYLPSAEINLLELSLRYYHQRQKLEPWHLKLVEVGNYLTSSPVFKMSAWRTRVDIGRTGLASSAREDWRSRIGGGYGRSWGNGETLLGYAFLTSELEHGPQAGLRKHGNQPRWAFGPGMAAGFVWQGPANTRSGLDLQSTRFVAGAKGTAHQLNATAQWNYRHNHALRLQLGRELRQHNLSELQLAWLRHF